MDNDPIGMVTLYLLSSVRAASVAMGIRDRFAMHSTRRDCIQSSPAARHRKNVGYTRSERVSYKYASASGITVNRRLSPSRCSNRTLIWGHDDLSGNRSAHSTINTPGCSKTSSIPSVSKS